MARINVSLSGIERKLLNRLAEAEAEVTLHDLRLAAGAKILSPKDNPSTFVTLSNFQSQLSTVNATLANVTAANSLVSQTRTTLDQIVDQLDLIRDTLADPDSNLDGAHRAAAQATIDEAIDQINTLATTSIDGRQILNGSADYQIFGGNPAQVSDVRVYSTQGGARPNAAPVTIAGTVTEAATQAELVYTGSGGQTTSAAQFTLTGERGSATIDVLLNEDLADVAEKINEVSHETGVVASVDGDELTLTSVDYGTRAGVAVTAIVGTFDVTGGNGDGTANGSDAVAIVNRITYDSNVDGNRFTINDNGMLYEIEFAPGFSGDFNPITVDGEALTFALATGLTSRSTLAIPSLQSTSLGGISGKLSQIFSGGDYSGLDANTSRAIRIVDEAAGQLTKVQGLVDGFYNAAITSSSQLLTSLQEDLDASIEQTDGYNEDEEQLLLQKSQELVSNAQAGLLILYDQRSSIIHLIQHIAGLV